MNNTSKNPMLDIGKGLMGCGCILMILGPLFTIAVIVLGGLVAIMSQ